MKKNTTSLLCAALALLVVGAGCVDRKAQEQAKSTSAVINDPVRPVTVEETKATTLIDSIAVNGEVTTSTDAQVGAKAPGKLTSVLVREGDAVTAGQLLATLDATSLVPQAAQARAQIAAASAQLSQAQNNARLAPNRSNAAVRQAEAQLRQARAQLLKLQNGARTEERAQSEANVRSAKSNLETQKKELERVKTLVAEGAIAANRLDQQLNAYEAALAQYQNAIEAANLVKNATRPEDLSAAKESVRQAEQAVASAKASKSLDVVLDDQVAAARAQLQSAQSALAIVTQAIADTRVTAPFSGRVAGKPLQPGVSIGSGTPIVRLVGTQGIYFEGQVPSDSLTKVKVGTGVSIKVDALSDQTFTGKVVAINPLADAIGRLFKVRVQFDGAPGAVSPGMFAKAEVTVNQIAGAIMIPSSAVVKRAGETYVMVADADKAKKMPVKVGISKGSQVQVIGLPTGVKVITEGQTDIVEGTKVSLKSAKSAQLSSNRGS